MLVKVCGMRDSRNIRDVVSAGANLIGLIFYDRSPRFVNTMPRIPAEVKRVGVFVNASAADIASRINAYGLDMVQLHGNETSEFVRFLRPAIAPVKILKAIGISCEEDIRQCGAFEDCVDMFLFDTRCPVMGGSGRQFDWRFLDSYCGAHPFLLSGGIGPDDASRIAAIRHPMLAGVDLNSRFETSPAMKDTNQIREFIQSINKQQQRL